uniref:Adenylyl cyclase-associated protein n=1 Tax=Neogobius melanostomus TaxID=47308 RepID=A0A8C6TK19_9GOBI
MAELSGLVTRLEAAVGRLESMSLSGGGRGGGGAAVGGGAVAPFVVAYDAIVGGAVAQYLSLSQKIGGDVQKHADMMKQGFSGLRQVLVLASTHQKPSDAELGSLIQPVSKAVVQVQEFREKNRSSPLFNHLSAVSESVPCLGWITMAPKPGPYVKEMMDAGVFYTNRVLKDYKEKDKLHVDWVKAYNSIWTELQTYIKAHHTTGLVPWPRPPRPLHLHPLLVGGPTSARTTPSPGLNLDSGSGDGAGDTRNELFASINKGADITKGLKHVDDTQKTHKNPGLRSVGGPIRSGPKPFSAAPKPAAAAPAQTQPPVSVSSLQENQQNVQGLVISDTELKQVVYAFKCNQSTLQVKGKINSITIDNCKKMGLVFDDVVGIVEIINSRDIKVQVMGKVPTISINKTDGCHVYLSKDSLSCEIVSAKSSEMNILVPKDDGDFVETPVPEQFKTVWNGEKLVTTATEIAG